MEDDLLQEFITESREHLRTIEADLLAIEEAGAKADADLLNKVFRAAHSIKGASGFFELTKVKDLAHKAETVLDMLRSRKMISNAEITNVLLRAFDKLHELIETPGESNHADTSAELEALQSLASSYERGTAKASLTKQLPVADVTGRETASIVEYDLKRFREGAMELYCIKADLLNDFERNGKNILRVIRELQSVGEVVDCKIDFPAVGTLDDAICKCLPVELIQSTSMSADQISAICGVPLERIFKLQLSASSTAVPADVAPAAVIHEPPPCNISQQTHLPPEAPPSQQRESSSTSEDTLRVNVGLLDALMNLAGELVLSRNQFQAAIGQNNHRMLTSAGQKLSQVTSEIQEAIMRTRLQPIENVFSRLPRVVRDLSNSLGKDVKLEIVGRDVALDRSMVEGLSDPLTHMVRNAIDHGIESPADRERAGKSRTGLLRVEAKHEAGQVLIDISDDGKGIDHEKVTRAALAKGLVTQDQLQAMTLEEKAALVLLPGLSTSEKVTQVSGRGVGMDVVKTNLDRLGGQVEITSKLGSGTLFRIKLPLTLTIIPALIVSVDQERFAIPQINVEELLRIRNGDKKRRIEVIGDTKVLVLRDRILPLLRLGEFLGIEASSGPNFSKPSVLEIAVVTTGRFRYGLVVESFHNTEEIVVKPLGRDLKQSREYAGATILGDGTVALVLDASGLAAKAELASIACNARAKECAAEEGNMNQQGTAQSLLLFRNSAEEHCAVPMEIVRRIERIKRDQLEMVGKRRTMKYRDKSLPLLALSDVATVEQIGEDSDLAVIVSSLFGHEIGLLVSMPVDVFETEAEIDTTTHRQPGVSGSAIVQNQTTLLVDLVELLEATYPEWKSEQVNAPVVADGSVKPSILLAEDSDFFRAQVKKYLEADGNEVFDAVDGEDAWKVLLTNLKKIQVVVTDIEMPRLSGLGLTERIRHDERTKTLPVIAVSSLAGDEDMANAKAAGVDNYQIKLDRDSLLAQLHSMLNGASAKMSSLEL